jgi:asparagine synthase (glutamine-hydrolysing)
VRDAGWRRPPSSRASSWPVGLARGYVTRRLKARRNLSGVVELAQVIIGTVCPVTCADEYLRRMVDASQVMSSDSLWVWRDHRIALGLNSTRLSRRCVSDFLSETAQHVLAVSGTVYGHGECEGLLTGDVAQRYQQEPRCLIEAAVDTWGFQETLGKLSGSFVVAFWDKREGILQIARDRLGKSPLYYGWIGEAFVFSSTIRAFEGYPSAKTVRYDQTQP